LPNVDGSFLPRDATQSAVMRLHVVCPSVCPVRPTAKVSEEANRKLPAKNMTVRLLILNVDPERHDGQRH